VEREETHFQRTQNGARRQEKSRTVRVHGPIRNPVPEETDLEEEHSRQGRSPAEDDRCRLE
jgi:hypothetical protein